MSGEWRAFAGRERDVLNNYARDNSLPLSTPLLHSASPLATRHSSLIPVRMRSAPFPGRADDGLDGGEPRLPAELLLDTLRRRDQHGGIAGPPLDLVDGDGMPSDRARRLDDFADGE